MIKVFMCSALLVLAAHSHAQQPAEVMPLADESLMLSVAKVGNELIMVGERGHILKSNDGGQYWRQIENVPVNITLTKVVVQNRNVWAVGHDAAIIHSSDAGETWELQFYDADREVPLLSAHFVDENTGFVIGAYGTILSTTDGGQNWNDDLISEELDYHLNDITLGEDGNYYIAAEAGYFFRSLDAGETWEDVELPYMGSMFGVETLGDEIILFGLRGNVLSSMDQGLTWEEISASEPNNLFGATALDDDKLLLVGANGARLVYQNQSLEQFKGGDSGDDYADALISGSKVLLIGETGYKFQALAQ
ncbi:YCF48-related protein [Marinicella sp. S1101]|uniref:WD40/YVTN/BNR-like repeat-containing protein n=1 Tax=Marinicella marina TaxID=2996016 RepID=UPI002260A6CA|nr:YCF48-related protein [Marinicella marina]MCX7554784.1 YCF48-related protein [Marinicella marina]MDJ1140983.1 YCF48-related protein [Marinicella marina]